jgi:hypothetical protein
VFPAVRSNPKTFPPVATEISVTARGIGWKSRDQVRPGVFARGAKWALEISAAAWYIVALLSNVMVRKICLFTWLGKTPTRQCRGILTCPFELKMKAHLCSS